MYLSTSYYSPDPCRVFVEVSDSPGHLWLWLVSGNNRVSVDLNVKEAEEVRGRIEEVLQVYYSQAENVPQASREPGRIPEGG